MEHFLLSYLDLMDIKILAGLQKNVYPLYDELKDLRGLNGVKDHLSYVGAKQEDYSKKNICKYLKKAIEQYLPTVKRQDLNHDEDLKTIKELADELGVSKSYVDKIIRILKLHTKLDKVGNKYVISKKQEKSIITRIENSKSTTETHTESTTQSHTKVDAEVDFLKEEIAYLKSNHDKQLTNKDKQIETLSNLLDQQQRLALQDKKLLEEYKAEINDLKALKMPSEDTKEEQSNYRSLEKRKGLCTNHTRIL